MTTRELHPVHPGEILLEEFLKPMDLTQARLARDLKLTPRRINAIVRGKCGINAEIALRLARYFGNSPKFWLGLQSDYDIDMTRKLLGRRITREVKTDAIKVIR
jgi:addiction module HigA family antidote